MKLVSCYVQPGYRNIVVFDTYENNHLTTRRYHSVSYASIDRLAQVVINQAVHIRPYLTGLVGYVATFKGAQCSQKRKSNS